MNQSITLNEHTSSQLFFWCLRTYLILRKITYTLESVKIVCKQKSGMYNYIAMKLSYIFQFQLLPFAFTLILVPLDLILTVGAKVEKLVESYIFYIFVYFLSLIFENGFQVKLKFQKYYIPVKE